MDNIKQVQQLISDAKNITVLTGSGISAESGIPTFRSKDGIWNTYNVEKYSTPEGFKKDPKDVWEWYEDRREEMSSKEPNPAHIALVELEKIKNVFIITQNIDDLHERAGSTNVIKIHGNVSNALCQNCEEQFPLPKERSLNLPPKCEKCGSIMRPSVVWFNEDLPIKESTYSFYVISNKADLLLVVGTSNMVSTSIGIMQLAFNYKVPIVVINTNYDHDPSIVKYFIKGEAGTVLPALINHLHGEK